MLLDVVPRDGNPFLLLFKDMLLEYAKVAEDRVDNDTSFALLPPAERT